MSEGKQEAREPQLGERESKPSAQFDWYWRSNPSNFEQVKTLDGQMILAWHAWCAALYLNGQEKAQPESAEDDQRARENAHKILGKVYSKLYTPVEQAAFQRGQQAMAEKAAQCDGRERRFLEDVLRHLNYGITDEELWSAKTLVEERLRSLASAEPPQESLVVNAPITRSDGLKFEKVTIAEAERRLLNQSVSLRSLQEQLAAIVPPQGEAEKEGRT